MSLDITSALFTRATELIYYV